MDCLSGAVVAVSDELVSSIAQVVNLFLVGNCPPMLGEYIASAPLTPLVKPGGGIRPIVLVMKRVAKTIGLMNAIAKINDPQCELLLLRSCTCISRLYFTMRTCPPRFFESAQCSFDVALRSSLEHIVTASRPGFGDWRWRLATLPFTFRGIGVYSAGDVLNYAFLASRLQSVDLQTKLLRHTGIVSPGPIFDDVLSVFNTSMETDLLSNPSEIAVPKLMKKMTDIYFTRVTKNAESTFSLSSRQMALWASQREDHTSDWLRTVSPYFLVRSLVQLVHRFFAEDIYGDHAVSCAGIIGIKHRHNVVPDTLVDICYRSGISVGKEIDIGMTDFVPGQAVIDAAQRKRGKYMDKCAAIGYGFLPFSFSSLGELEADAVSLLKRIRKFSMTQDIGARAAVHIFNRISFAIAKRVVDGEITTRESKVVVVARDGGGWSGCTTALNVVPWETDDESVLREAQNDLTGGLLVNLSIDQVKASIPDIMGRAS
ncbi:hypothetical protein Tco_0243090 [Tanacetum coccineum]